MSYTVINDNLTLTTPKINNLTREPNHTPLPHGHAALSRERPRSIHLLDQPQHPRHHCLACGRLDGESMRHTFLHRHRHARSRGARRRLARRLVARVQGVWRDPDRGQLAAAAALCAHSSVSPSAYSSAYRWSRVSRRNHEPRRRLCGKRRSPARRRSAPSARRSRTARRAPSPGDTLTGAAAEAVRESAPSCLASSRKRVRMLRTAPKRGSARAVNDTISGQKRRT